MKILILAIIILFSFTDAVFAQMGNNGLSPESGIEINPPFPQPGDSIKATINDYSGYINGAIIKWYLNDEEIENSLNQRQVNLVIGFNTNKQTLKAVIIRPNNTQQIHQKIITPAYLDIIIEPQTRVPSFYKGRPLPSIGSTINATALIASDGFKDPDLIYNWKVNNKVIGGGSLRGQNQVSFVTPLGKDVVVSVEVSELDGHIIASRSVILMLVEPEIKFYEVNPLFGIKEKTIADQVRLLGKGLTIKAEPYYLDINVYNNPAINKWDFSGGNYEKTNSNPYEVTVSRAGNLSFHVRDTKQVLQGAESAINISF